MKASIIIPTYNAEKTIKKCIQSAINQTISKNEYEILIIDDQSEDDTVMILEKYLKEFNNIRLIKQMNRGQCGAQNRGISEAEGEYICYLHDDDVMENCLLDKCISKMEKYNLDFINFNYKISYDFAKNRDSEIFELKNIESNKIMTGVDFFVQERWAGPEFAFMFNRKFLIDNNLLFDETLKIGDFDFMIRLFMSSNRVMRLDDILYIHKQSNYNTTNNMGYMKYVNTRQIALYKYCDIIQDYIKKDIRILNSASNYFIDELIGLVENVKLLKGLNTELILKTILNIFINKYIKIFINKSDINIYMAFLNLINLTEYVSIMNGENKLVDNLIKETLDKVDAYRRKILMEMPFDKKNFLIGIYGIGSHTMKMLEYYTKNIGKIEAEIKFIDSDKGNNNEKFKGKEIVNVKNVNNFNFDCIIISSFSFEDQLIMNLKHYEKKNIPIYRIYKNLKYILFK